MHIAAEVHFHTQIVGYLDGCNMECISLLLGLEMLATLSSSLIIGHGSDGIFIGFKASFCETALGHCRPSSSCIAPATCAMTNNTYLY